MPGLAVLDLERETGEPLRDGAVELGLVLLGSLLAERGREMIAQIGEDLGRGLDDVLVVAVMLLGVVAPATVVLALSLLRLPDQVGVVAFEEVELA